MDDDKKKKKKKGKFSFLRAIGMKITNKKEPTIQNTVNVISKRKKDMKALLDSM